MSGSHLGPPQTRTILSPLATFRRSSEGNYTTPTQIIFRIPKPPPTIMEVCQRTGRAQSLTGGEYIRPSSPFESRDRKESESNQTGSACSSPSSSRRSSINSCTELVSALEALTLELQSAELEHREPVAEAEESLPEVQSIVEVTRSIYDEKKNAWSKDIAEKEKLLTECKNQIQSLSHGRQQLERRVDELQKQVQLCEPFRIANKKASAKSWPKLRINVKDLHNAPVFDDQYVEVTEIVNAFLESERHYLNKIGVLHRCYELPLRMLCTYKPDVISLQQIDSIFLNCSDLVLIHRLLYEELSQLPSLPESVQVDKLLEIFERVFSSFHVYSSFMDTSRAQSVQKELKQLMPKKEFSQLLEHCQENCDGVRLSELLQLPGDRMAQYSDLLTHLLDPHVRGMSEDGSLRAEALIKFLRNLRYELLEDKSDREHTMEKIKLLHKLASDVPLEVFNSDVYLIKQGPLNLVLGSREVPRHCFLFNKYIAVAEKANDTQFKLSDRGMIPLSEAQLHKCVDVEGQAISSDLQSGRSEDRLAFRLTLSNNESLFLRASRPNVLKGWVEALDKSLQEHQASQTCSEQENFTQPYPDAGSKIASASLERLFQQLTSPHMFRDDFMEVFLMTHSCFTSPKEVLTALLNCVKRPDDTWSDTSSQGSSSAAFPFNMDELANDSDGSCASSPVTPRTQLDPRTLATRKSVHSGSSQLSTSDSDVSPHTSAIVVDHPQGSEGLTQNGWIDPEMSINNFTPVHRAPVADKGGLAVVDEDSHYTKLYPRSRVHVACDGSGDESEPEGGGQTPRQSSLTGSIEVGTPGLPKVRQRIKSESGADNTDGHIAIAGDTSSTGTKDLEDMSKMLGDMIGSLENLCSAPNPTIVEEFESSLDKKGLSRDRTASLSDPDITDKPPALPSRAELAPDHNPPKSLLVHSSSEHSSLTQSLNMSRSISAPNSPYHVINRPGRSSSVISVERSPTRGKKSMTMDRSPEPKTPKKSKKGGSMGDYYRKGSAPVTMSLNPAMLQQLDKSPKRSKWSELKNKINIGKKKRSPSLEPEDFQSLRYPRRGSIHSLTHDGVAMADGGTPRPQRSNSSHGNNVALVAKIFAVIDWWQDQFFEDFEDDVELKKMLCEFLSVMAKKSSSGSVESEGASSLLECVEHKSFQGLTNPPASTFPVQLAKTINVKLDTLMMYDWDHPDKLVPEKTFDLSKIKDSHFLRVISEQLTIMEFSVYAAIQRRELLCCNWKKKNKDTLAPNVCRLIKRTNEMTSWVSTEILSQETAVQRATVIENFIRIAYCCYQNNDMHCSLNITIALGSACIKCLRQTWEEVDKKYKRQLEKLKEWTDYQGRCKKMREKLEKITADQLGKSGQLPLALPYVGAYLDQIYSLEMSSKTYNPNGLVNFAKMTKLAAILKTTLQYQTQRFAFEPKLDVMVYVTAAKRLSENDLYELSNTREP